MSNEPSLTSQEPEAGFLQRCNTIVGGWQANNTPFEQAVNDLHQMAGEAETAGHLPNQAVIQYFLGYVHGYRGDLNGSIVYFERAKSLFEQAQSAQGVNRCVLSLGESYRQKGNTIYARRHFQEAYDNAVKMGDVSTQMIARINEGQLLISVDKPVSARTALEDGLRIAAELDEDERNALCRLLCEAHYALATVDLADKKTEAAWQHARQAYELAVSIDQPLEMGYASRTMGEVLTVLPNPPDDLGPDFSTNPNHHFEASVEAFRSIKSESELGRSLHAFGRSLAARGLRTAAAQKLRQAMMIFSRHGMVEESARANETYNQLFMR